MIDKIHPFDDDPAVDAEPAGRKVRIGGRTYTVEPGTLVGFELTDDDGEAMGTINLSLGAVCVLAERYIKEPDGHLAGLGVNDLTMDGVLKLAVTWYCRHGLPWGIITNAFLVEPGRWIEPDGEA